MKYAAVVLTPAVLALVPLAQAQQGVGASTPVTALTVNQSGQPLMPHPFSVRVGADYPTDGNARHGFGNIGLRVGLGYDIFKGFLNPKTGVGSVDFDYLGFRAHGNQFDAYSLQYVERVGFSAPTNGFQPYWGLGVGVVYDRATAGGGSSLGNGGASTGGGSYNKTQIAGEVILGAKFNQFFVEAAWHLQPSIQGVSPDTISLAVGMHF